MNSQPMDQKSLETLVQEILEEDTDVKDFRLRTDLTEKKNLLLKRKIGV